jgi:vancomycin resistance protein YoaR
MNARRMRIAASIAVPMLILLLPLVVYLVDRTIGNGEVPRNVSVAGIDVGGLSRPDAIAVIHGYETGLQNEKATFVVSGSAFDLDPLTVGLTADVDAAVGEAMEQRAGGIVGGFLPWLHGFTESVDIALPISIDDEAVAQQIAEWEREAITDPAYEGSIEVIDGVVEFEYPRIGERIDKPAAIVIVDDTLSSPIRDVTTLPLTDAVPELTHSDIDAAVDTLELMMSRPVVLHDEDQGRVLTVKPSEIADATVVEIVRHSPAQVNISLSPDRVAAIIAPHRAEFELPPVDASFDVDIETDTVTIIPSKNATVLDADAITDELLAAATSGTATGRLFYTEGEEPEYTTADAEAFGPLGLVSEFTTKTPGVNRVHNIHLMADTIDGYVVWPGEEFSINEVVGRRTEAKGYKRDGAIIGGVVTCCDDPANVGGGVSQYGTTIYNAIFFGCYEDLEHTPHSLYISRYPEGREATLGYPAPDVRFRNDSEAPVIIRNSYDENKTITVKFYGNNGGRTCEAERSERFNYTEPRTVYTANPAVTPGTERVVSKGSKGWSVTVTRVMTMPDGTVIRQPFTHRYRGHVREIEKNPCDLGMGACPVRVPSVMYMSAGDATATLSGAGFGVSQKTAPTGDPNVDGKVISQSPGGTQKPGTTITITIGVYSGGGGEG